ncbi:uncharacterized protein Tco025E_09114 [Trypanosoma conorhini]|uniref:Transcription factor Pcc1 n=1 Tax=Trypanosoma conorhini TaxID=83891 RepID=A0A3R7KPR1_9TRYP|nr:uncharacterized protein Tco025E_09114 [Trypanosoma conorhini]RNE98949.1 hypothetical protein Tco025E_09114 [Trypanosoma conorhini]
MQNVTTRAGEKDQEALECVLRLPLQNAESAHIMMQVLRVEPPVPGTSKEVQLWADDSTRSTVYVKLEASKERSLRAAVGALLEQSKLILRTMDAFPLIARQTA